MAELSNLYTYAFLETPEGALELPVDIRDRTTLVSHGGVSALVEPNVCIESLQSDDQQLIQAVLSHDRIICELFRLTTVLPLRFGTAFSSEESIIVHLKSEAETYLKKLHQLKGKAEYVLKLIPQIFDEPTPSTQAKGRQYFLAKKQQYQAQQNFQIAQTQEQDNLIQLINQTYQSTVVDQKQDGTEQIYLLISDQNQPQLTEQFIAWQKACPRWELQLGEAQPPYHFI